MRACVCGSQPALEFVEPSVLQSLSPNSSIKFMGMYVCVELVPCGGGCYRYSVSCI